MRYVASPILTSREEVQDAGVADEDAPAAPSQERVRPHARPHRVSYADPDLAGRSLPPDPRSGGRRAEVDRNTLRRRADGPGLRFVAFTPPRLDPILLLAVQLSYATRSRRAAMQRSSRQAGPQREAAGLVALRVMPLVLIILLAVSYLIAIPAGLIGRSQRLGTPEVIFAAALIIALAFATQTRYAITDLTLGSGGVSAHFRQIEAGLSELEAEVRALQVSLTGLVTKWELAHLRNLAATGPALVRFGNIMQGELTRLDAMEFIRPNRPGGLNIIRDDHSGGLDDFDLKDYVEITQEGREYLALREQLAARTARTQADH